MCRKNRKRAVVRKRGKDMLLALFFVLSILVLSACEAGTEDTSGESTTLSAVSVEVETFTEEMASEPASDAEETAAKRETEFRDTHDLLWQEENYSVYLLPFERDGMYIYGQLFLPDDGASAHPLVIIGHGLQSSYADCIPDAAYFADAGIAAYVFDFCGGSSYSESDGAFEDMSVLTEKADMESVLDGLCGYPFFDQNKIFLMGESQGGLVAALLAPERPEDVAGLVLFFPGLGIPENARAVFGEKDQIPEDPASMGYMGYQYYYDVIDMDAYEQIRAFDKPVLIVHGDADEVVPLYYSEQAKEVYPDAELLVLPGAGHGFFDEALHDACTAAVDFVRNH